MTVFVVGRILLHGDYCILTKDSMLNDFYHMYSVRRILLSADKTLFHSFYCPSQKGGIYVDETLLIEFIAYWQKDCLLHIDKRQYLLHIDKRQYLLHIDRRQYLLHIDKRQYLLHNNSFSSTGSGPGMCVGGTTHGVGERGGHHQRSTGQGSRHGEIWFLLVVVDRFYIAQCSTLEQTYCACMWYDMSD